MISESDARHLECVERASFQPVGWLYLRVFDDLLQRGLVTITVTEAYIISDHGADELKKFREHARTGCQILEPVEAVYSDPARQVLLSPPGTRCRDCGSQVPFGVPK
jgi:hypothetical protein